MIARHAARRALALALVVGAAGAGASACGGGASKGAAAPLSSTAVADPAARLMAFVPADASFVFVRDQQAMMADRFSDLSQLPEAMRGLRAVLDPHEGPGTAFVAGLLDALAAPGAARDALGWQEGQSVLVVYGLGFDTVLRASLDGRALRATLERTAAESRFPLTPLTARGHTYYRIEVPTPAFAMTVVLRIDGDGAVAAIGGDGDRLVAHVLADAPDGPRFDVAATVSAAYPARRGEARFAMAVYPQRLSAALAQVIARRPAWLTPIAACADAGVDFLAATPAMRLAWVPRNDRFESVALVDLTPPTAERLARELQPIPRWSRADDRLRAGIGVGPRTLFDTLEPWLNAVDHLASACGSPTAGGISSLKAAMLPAPVALIGAAAFELEPRTQVITAVLGARDLQALWASLRSLVPTLRPQAPAPGEQVGFQGVTFVGGGDALGLTVSGAGVPALGELMASGPGPRELFAFDLPAGVIDELRRRGEDSALASTPFASLALHVGLRDRRLVVTIGADAASSGARPQLAH